MKALVTGGAGFIGSHLVDALLARGIAVTVVDNFSLGRDENLKTARERAREKNLELKVLKENISDPDLWNRLGAHEIVFHLAAQTSVPLSVKEPIKDFENNVLPIQYLAQWLRKYKAKYLIYANSVGVYGNVDAFPTSEKENFAPLSPYGASKGFFEHYVSAFVNALKDTQYFKSDINSEKFFSWTSLRLGNVYGPRQISKGEGGVVPTFIEGFLQKEHPTVFGEGDVVRDYVYVDDVVSAFLKALDAMQTRSVDDVFNVACENEISTEEVYDAIAAALKERSVDVPSKPQRSELRPGEIKRSFLSVDKIKKQFSWKPETSFKEGIKKTVEHYLAHEKLS